VRTSASLSRLVPLASGTVALADVLDVLLDYPADTVAYYDFAGTSRPQASTANHVSLDDLGRVTLMNPKISGADAARLLALRLDPALWAAVPRDADLTDADPTVRNGLYDAAAQLQRAPVPRSAKRQGRQDYAAQAAGVLPGSRPPALLAVPRAGGARGVLCSLYRERAEHEASQPDIAWRGHRRSYWSAVRSDLLAWRAADAFTALRAELDGTDRHGWTQLTDLRLLDITYGRSAATPSPGGRR